MYLAYIRLLLLPLPRTDSALYVQSSCSVQYLSLKNVFSCLFIEISSRLRPMCLFQRQQLQQPLGQVFFDTISPTTTMYLKNCTFSQQMKVRFVISNQHTLITLLIAYVNSPRFYNSQLPDQANMPIYDTGLYWLGPT